MPQVNLPTLNVDLTRIENAEVRRAIRQLIRQLQEIVAQQQVQIEALIEMTVDKHIWSLGEYRRAIQKISQSASGRNDRIHAQVAQVMRDNTAGLQATPQEVDAPDDQGRQIYRL
jgi:hypothetical protein